MVQFFNAVLFLAISSLLSSGAFAQSQKNSITLEFNRSPSNAVKTLEQRGFTNVEILKRRLFALEVKACREGIRYNFKLRLDGHIYDDRRVGSCSNQLTKVEIRKIAKNAGFNQINISEVANGFRVTGCRPDSNRREQLTFNLAGKVIDSRILGACRQRQTFDEIAAKLSARGLDRIRLMSDEDQRYVIRVCDDAVRVELEIGLTGRILANRAIGKCRSPIQIAEILPLMREAGFNRLVLKDKEPPRYLIEGCRDERRYEIKMNRYGETDEPLVVGRCRPVMNVEALKKKLFFEGFYNVKIENGRRAKYLATLCYAKRKFEIDYSAFGDLLSEREIGACRTMNAAEMRSIARARDADRLETRIKACKNNTVVVYALDRDGIFVARPQRGSRC